MAPDLQRDRLDAGLLAVALLQDIDIVAAHPAPALVHAQEHFRPVLGLGTACSGMDLEIAVVGIGFTGQQCLELPGPTGLAQRPQDTGCLGDDLDLVLGLAEFHEIDGLLKLPLDVTHGGDRALKRGPILQDHLCALVVQPQIRITGKSVQFVQSDRCRIPVKDASA